MVEMIFLRTNFNIYCLPERPKDVGADGGGSNYVPDSPAWGLPYARREC